MEALILISKSLIQDWVTPLIHVPIRPGDILVRDHKSRWHSSKYWRRKPTDYAGKVISTDATSVTISLFARPQQ